MEYSGRLLEILFRAMRGEELSIRKLAGFYKVSTRSISRDISDIKTLLANNRELVGYAELDYNHATKSYRITSSEFLTDKELFAVTKVILGSRAFSEIDMVELIAKFKRFTNVNDHRMLDKIVYKELHHYSELKHDCDNVTETLWRLAKALNDKREITIRYYKMNRTLSEKRVQPVSLVFMEYYFYLIAYYPEQYEAPRYFRVDRIKDIMGHKKTFDTAQIPDFDEGLLRKQCQFMFYGKPRKIRFSFTGPSIQAILDRLPTARIVEYKQGAYIVEAEIQGDGIKMYLLSQGSWVKVLEPEELAIEMKAEIDKMCLLYGKESSTYGR